MGFGAEMRDFVNGFRAGRSMIRDKTEKEREEEALRKATEKGTTDAVNSGRERPSRTGKSGGSGSSMSDDGQGGNATHSGYTGGGDEAGLDSPRERAGFSPGGTKGLTDNAIGSVDTSGDQALLALLRKDGGNYDAMTYKKDGTAGGRAPFQDMTIAQIYDHQKWMEQNGYASTAVGAYQTVHKTLAKAVQDLGLDPSKTRFDKTTQDKIALHLAKQRGYDDFKAGKIDAKTFAGRLAQEWAILPKDASGKSHYQGFNRNAAGVGWDTTLATLERARKGATPPAMAGPAKGAIPERPTVTAGGDDPVAEHARGLHTEAISRGLVPGTPEFIDFVVNGSNAFANGRKRNGAAPAAEPTAPAAQVSEATDVEPEDDEAWAPTMFAASGGAVPATKQADVKPGVNAPWPGEPIRGGVPARPSSFNFQGAPQTMVGNYVSPNGAIQGTPEFDVEMLRAQNGAWGFQGNAHDTQQYGGWQGGGNPAPAYMEYWDRPYGTPPTNNGGYYADAPVDPEKNPAPGPQMRRTALTDRLEAARAPAGTGGNMMPQAPRPAAAAAPAAQRSAPAQRQAIPAPQASTPQASATSAPAARQAAAPATTEAAEGEPNRWADMFRERRQASQDRQRTAQEQYNLDQQRAAQKFDANAYLKYNPDLKMTEFEAAQHYNTIGKNEGRVWWDQPRAIPEPSTLPSTATTAEKIADLRRRREESKKRLQNPVSVADAPESQIVRGWQAPGSRGGRSTPPYQQAITGYTAEGNPIIAEESGNIWDGYYGDVADENMPWARGMWNYEQGGMVEGGNIDLNNRPRAKNADGSTSTVRSMSIGVDGMEVLIPTVSEDGRVMSDDEAIRQFEATGRHLGKFKTPEAATEYARRLSGEQADMLQKRVKNYAEGGMVDDEEETQVASLPPAAAAPAPVAAPVTSGASAAPHPAPPPRPQAIPERAQAPVTSGGTRAPVQEEDPHSKNPAGDFNAKQFAKVDPDAVKGGMNFITQFFGLDTRPTQAVGGSQAGLQAFARNEGGFSTEEVRAAKDTVDPRKTLTDGERTLAALHAGYRFYESKGDFAKANAYAGRMLMHIKKVVATGGVMAQAALENGDVPRAAKIMQEAHAYSPDGMNLKVLNADRSGVAFQLIDEEGNITREGRATIDEMMYMATGMQNGTEWFRAAGAIATKSAKERRADRRLELAEERQDMAWEQQQSNQKRYEEEMDFRRRTQERQEKQFQETQRKNAENEKLKAEEAAEKKRVVEGYEELKAEVEAAIQAKAQAGNIGENMDADKALEAAQAKVRAWIGGHPGRRVYAKEFAIQSGAPAATSRVAPAAPAGRTAIPETGVPSDDSVTPVPRRPTREQTEMQGEDLITRENMRKLNRSSAIPPVPTASDPNGDMPIDAEAGPWMAQGDGFQPGTAHTKAFDIQADGEFRKNADEPPDYTTREAINAPIRDEVVKSFTSKGKREPEPELADRLTNTVQGIMRGNNVGLPEAVRITKQAYDPAVPLKRNPETKMYNIGGKEIRLGASELNTIMELRANLRRAGTPAGATKEGPPAPGAPKPGAILTPAEVRMKEAREQKLTNPETVQKVDELKAVDAAKPKVGFRGMTEDELKAKLGDDYRPGMTMQMMERALDARTNEEGLNRKAERRKRTDKAIRDDMDQRYGKQ